MNYAENQKTALFVSPHLDDVIFSCGGTLAKMHASGWETILCTIFTKSVADPQGFALACQLDKNLPADADYMKLRRAEDWRAAKILNVSKVLHLDFLEAPHRGYQSAPELFAGIKDGDEIWKPVAENLKLLNEIFQPKIIFAPQGLGNHCDHLQTIQAARRAFEQRKLIWYRDTPYAIRQPAARISELLPSPLLEIGCNIRDQLNDKIAACAAYLTQIKFQFGGHKSLALKLAEFHMNESQRINSDSRTSETFLVDDCRSEAASKKVRRWRLKRSEISSREYSNRLC